MKDNFFVFLVVSRVSRCFSILQANQSPVPVDNPAHNLLIVSLVSLLLY